MDRYHHKSVYIAYGLWLVSGCGWLGLHRIYLNKYKTCAMWTFTFGLFGLGSLADLFALPRLVQRYNIIQQIKALNFQLERLDREKMKLEKEGECNAAAACLDQEVILWKQLTMLKSKL